MAMDSLLEQSALLAWGSIKNLSPLLYEVATTPSDIFTVNTCRQAGRQAAERMQAAVYRGERQGSRREKGRAVVDQKEAVTCGCVARWRADAAAAAVARAGGSVPHALQRRVRLAAAGGGAGGCAPRC